MFFRELYGPYDGCLFVTTDAFPKVWEVAEMLFAKKFVALILHIINIEHSLTLWV